ncbi:MAG: hypothetical protein JWN01_904 [Patescibacteria group bacterium]|nr:hypothetical protein [Patescibacteria group bacterium]
MLTGFSAILRGMKKLLPLVLVTGFVIAGGAVLFAVQYFSSQYLTSHGTAAKQPAECGGVHVTHVVTIQNDVMNPQETTGKLCDVLTITNLDNKRRIMAFGVHDSHKAYNGVTEKRLEKSQSFSVVLNETGTYVVHDHLDDDVKSGFIVAK